MLSEAYTSELHVDEKAELKVDVKKNRNLEDGVYILEGGKRYMVSEGPITIDPEIKIIYGTTPLRMIYTVDDYTPNLSLRLFENSRNKSH